MSPTHRGPLSEAVAAVLSGETTATALVDDRLRAIDTSQPTLNAFTLVSHDRAIAAAAAVDRRLTAGEPVGPLAGAPIAVKDLIDQAGLPNTCGSGFPPQHSTESAPVIDRLETAGAVIVGRTGLHEFAFGFSSENPWFGPVRNPWDPNTSCGGSSGGSAAAVAARLVPGAVGTDTGGSVRTPAAMCAVVGLKVTHGRIPIRGVAPLAASLDTVGPLATTVGDVALLYAAMAGHDPADPWSRLRPVPPPGATPAPDTVRLGVPHPWVDMAMTDEVRTAWEHFLAAAADAGVTIVPMPIPEIEFPGLVIESTYPEVAAVHRRRFTESPERYGSDVADRVRMALDTDIDDYLAGLAWRLRVRDAAEAALTGCDALITPTVAATRKVIGIDTVDVGGEDVFYRGLLSGFTTMANQTGQPALSLPISVPGSPPPSVQLIGPRWAEHRLLELGAMLEDAGLAGSPVPPGHG